MPSPRLAVATCQFPVGLDVAANGAHIRRHIKAAADRGADVAHFPELAIAGFGYADRKREDWKSSWQRRDWAEIRGITETIRQSCREHGIWAVVGSSHSFDTSERPTNCVYIFDDAGDIVSRYDKRRCSQSDLHNHTPGEAPVIFEIKGVRCGVSICLEWSFPDIFSDYADSGGRSAVSFGQCRRRRGATPSIPTPSRKPCKATPSPQTCSSASAIRRHRARPSRASGRGAAGGSVSGAGAT